MNEYKSSWQIEYFRHSFPSLAAAKTYCRIHAEMDNYPSSLDGEKIIHYVDHKAHAAVTIKVQPNHSISFSRVHLV